MGAAREAAGPAEERGSPVEAADVLAEPKWWPPGFRFHPTDEELVLYYLKRRVCGRRLKPSMIGDVDVYKWEPWELPDKSALKTGDKQWYFFSPRDRKYPNGSRSNRATRNGYWKATGKDRTICQNTKAMGNKKTLVYYHGRAPKGERTDWVMHEYTLDEQVLLSYNNVQDSCALYKVFRKSGPGPKNGEQYGAPFREEEWDDDEVDESFRSQDNMELPLNERSIEVPVTEPLHVLSSTGTICDAGNSLPLNELEDLLLKLSDERDIVGQYSEHSAYISEVDVETQVVGHNLYPSLNEATLLEDEGIWGELSTLEESIEVARNDSSDMQPVESPELTSLTCNLQQPLQQTDEEFLEIKDFNDPESILWSENDLSNRDQMDGLDGFYDSYDYFDTPLAFSNDLGPLGLTTQNSYLDGYGDEGMILNRSYNISADLWNHDQEFSVSHANQNQVLMTTTTSGVANASTLSNMEQKQGQSTGVEGTSGSWISSAFSTLLDSVPSSPALASENAFISRALERVSSFRGQTGVNVQNTTIGPQSSSICGRRGGRNGGVLCVSLLVGLSAVFWVFTVGATIKVFKGFWSRFNSS